MKKWKRLLSLLLAVLMLSGALSGLTVTAFADETTATDGATSEEPAEGKEETETKSATEDYLYTVYSNAEAKLATMDKKLVKGDYELYSDSVSGEVAVKNVTTGQILMTNPYDIAAGRVTGTDPADEPKKELLSQIIIKFTDNGKERTFNSFEQAAEKDQITVKNIKNGIRVEYVIGREEARHLLPRVITDESFRTKILYPAMDEVCDKSKFIAAGLLQEGQSFTDEGVYIDFAAMSTEQYKDLCPFNLRQLISYYGGPDGAQSVATQKTDKLKKNLIAKYPVLNKKPDMVFWVFDATSATTQMERQEDFIKSYAPNYSYEDLDADHAETEYESDESNPPVFKMALEYTLEDDGFTVRLPVNGLSFNESLYQLTSISILPYMGAGNNAYDGYVFYPDGGGALFAMEDLVDAGTTTVSGKVYGADFAYHQITGTYQQTIRYPAYGIVENTRYYVCTTYDNDNNPIETPIAGVLYERIQQAEKDGKTIDADTHIGLSDIKTTINSGSVTEKTVKRGFVAIIEEGDALTNMAYYHAGTIHNYDTVRMDFNPRPQDKYNLADSISVGNNTEWTVITDRKYTGNFKVHYIMLDDDSDSTSGNSGINDDGQYAASWLGMAFAYRDYLEANNQLQHLTTDQTSGDIPLYIESFGTEYTTEKIASIPVSVKRALTSAADVKTIYEELAEQNITNVNFKLTGYANGGMYGKMPYKLKWEKSVQKSDTDADDMTMQELFDYAAEETDGLSLFPDFNFAYVMSTGWFDGLSMRKHVVRTIDDRYASRKEYSPTQQKYVSYYQMAISPAYMSHFYEEFMTRYLKMENLTGISVGSLGTALNSDFDEDEPYNREDARTFIVKALEYISSEKTKEGNTLEVMLDGGNVYTWKYANHILNLPLDSSRYIKASYSVPFIGVLLHGYMNFAGTPLNMEGDVNYAKLKAIENGASPYFLLSYKNTEILKEYYDWSHYYSVRYDIWKDDVVELYDELNEALSDVQDKIIINHEFLSGERVPDTDELEGDIGELFDTVLDYQQNQEEYDTIQKNQAVSEARKLITSAEEQATQFVKDCLNYYSGMQGAAYYFAFSENTDERLMAYVEADKTFQKVKEEYDAVKATYTSTTTFEKEQAALVSRYSSAESARKNALAKVRTSVRNISKSIQSIENATQVMEQLLVDVEEGNLLIQSSAIEQKIKDDIKKSIQAMNDLLEEKLGVKLIYTVNMNEVDMFLRAHVAVIMSTTYGESLRSQAGIVGKAENLFDLVLSGEYGLIQDEVEYAILRYLDVNADLTDSQLDEKYGLQDGKTSMDGLLKVMRELFDEEKYTFDPVLSDEKGADGYSEIDKHMLGYYTGMLYTRVTGLADTEILPTLNFKSTRLTVTVTETKDNEGHVTDTKTTIKEVNNKSNVDTVTKEITSAAKTAFEAFMKDKVAGNDYKVGLNELIDAQIEASREIIKNAYNNTEDKKRVEYLTGTDEQIKVGDQLTTATALTVDEVLTDEALGNDLRVFLTSYFYKLAIAHIQPEGCVDSLSVLTVSSKTSGSVGVLADDRYLALDAANLSYAELREAILNDAVADGKLALLLDEVKDVYGDVSSELRRDYLQQMALKRVPKGALPNDAQLPFAKDAKDKSEALASELVAKMLVEMTDAVEIDLTPYRAEVLALLNTEGAENTEAAVANFVDAVYLMALCQMKTDSYYYDSQMSAMDSTVRKEVAAKHDEIAATLPANATGADIYDAILKALGSTEDSVAQLTSEIASGITYYIETKYSISDEVQAYYINLLFNSFADQTGDYTEPVLTVYNDSAAVLEPTETTYKNMITAIKKKYVDARIEEIIASAKKGTTRGEIVDYSLSRLVSDEEMEAWITTVYNKIEDGKYLTADENKTAEAKAQLRSDIEAYLRYNYYQALFNDKMDAAKKAPTLHVSEVYGDSLPEASSGLKKLLRYYVTALTEFTEKDIDDMLTADTGKSDDVDTETSKYYTDDGRIVAVTYGSKDTTESTAKYAAYKTFLLNYNNFAVSVEYDGVIYTIPGYGYIAIKSN